MKLLQQDRDSIQSDLSGLIVEYDNMKFKHDTISMQLEKANEMMEQLKRERRWNYAKIKEYQKEVGTLRAVMKNYLRQIDSLNTLNQKLAKENVTIKKEVETANLRANVAEEKAAEYQNKIKEGSVLDARGIKIVPLNANDNEISRVKKAAALRVDFVVGANRLAQAGNQMIYLCIFSPDGYPLSPESLPTFTYQGKKKGYSACREVDYQNEDLEVSIFYKDSGFIPGNYKVELYMGGYLIGSAEIYVK